MAQSCRSRACRSCGAGSTGVRNTGVKSLRWGANCKVSRFFPKASAKLVAEFVRVGCLFCGLGLLMSLSVQQYTIGNSRRVLNG